MATGSGKTLMMAGLILYLYEKGYRNFLFFVNSTNIIDKTRDNFLNNTSIKYLFNQSLSWADKKIILLEVDNFQTTDNDNINICFETIQGLHSRLTTPRENSLTYEDFQDKFIRGLETLTSAKLSKIEANAKDEFITKIFKYLASNNISLDNFVIELKEDFSAEKTLSVNSKEESEEKQLAVNTLEDPFNEYRAIFAVDKLNEGWDVLNLFDIVRLYNTRDAKSNVPGPTTIKEAQLIGRGARYCPFKVNDSDEP